MSTKIILVGHGTIGTALLESLTMIMGPQNPDEVVAIEFYMDDSLDILKGNIEEQIVRIANEGDHLIVCCDMQGGSPFNASFLLSKKYPMTIICGMNLPMLLEFVVVKDMYETKEQVADLVDRSKDTLKVF